MMHHGTDFLIITISIPQLLESGVYATVLMDIGIWFNCASSLMQERVSSWQKRSNLLHFPIVCHLMYCAAPSAKWSAFWRNPHHKEPLHMLIHLRLTLRQFHWWTRNDIMYGITILVSRSKLKQDILHSAWFKSTKITLNCSKTFFY